MLWWKRHEGLRLRGKPTRCVAVTAELADTTAAVRATNAVCDVVSGWEQVENWGTCTLAFDDGSRGMAHGADTFLGGMQSHLTVLGSAFRFECALSPVDTLRAYAVRDGAFGSKYVMEKVHGQAGWSTPIPDEDEQAGQQGLVQTVAEALCGLSSDAAAVADGELRLEVVRVVYASYVSAATGRRVSI